MILKIVYFATLFPLAAFLLAALISKKRAKNRDEKIVSKKHGTGNPLYFIFKIYSSVPLLKSIFNKTYRKIEILYPSNKETVQRKTSEVLFRGTVLFFISVVFTLISSEGNIFYVCFSLVVIVFMFTQSINNSIRIVDDKILSYFSKYVEIIAENYYKYHIMSVAVYKSMQRAPLLISLHLKKIYQIVSSSNVKKKLDEYIGREPNRYLLELLSILTTTKEFGPKEIDNGKTTFSNGINQIKRQISDELLDRKKDANAFRGITYLALIPVILIKPIEMWADATIEGLGQYYDGIYGLTAMILIFISSTISYQLVSTLRNNNEEIEVKEYDEKSLWGRLSRIPIIKKFSDAMVEKKYTEYLKINSNLRSIGDHTGPNVFITKKIVYCIVAFVASIVIFVGADFASKVNTLSNFAEEFTDCVTPEKDYSEAMQQVAKNYTSSLKSLKASSLTEEELTEKVLKETEITKKPYAEQISSVVISRIMKYKNTFFRWYYVVLSAIISGIAYMVPTWLLKFKSNVVKMRMEDEVIQFQSLMLVLMHIDGTTLPTIMEWLERFAYVFKSDITKCRLQLTRGYTKALTKLKEDNEESCESFALFVDKLLNIRNVGVEKAFQRMEVDRESQIENRKEDQQTNRRKRMIKAGILAVIPLGIEFICFIIIPSFLMSYNMYIVTKQMF